MRKEHNHAREVRRKVRIPAVPQQSLRAVWKAYGSVNKDFSKAMKRLMTPALFFGLALSAFGAEPETKLNVLFLMADDLRPELASYGSPALTRISTDWLDALCSSIMLTVSNRCAIRRGHRCSQAGGRIRSGSGIMAPTSAS